MVQTGWDWERLRFDTRASCAMAQWATLERLPCKSKLCTSSSNPPRELQAFLYLVSSCISLKLQPKSLAVEFYF